MRRAICLTIAFVLVTVAATSAEAQPLARAEVGRVAVAQCYARCNEPYHNQLIQIGRLSLDSTKWPGDWDDANVIYTVCQIQQQRARLGDMCRAGCLDIEAAYGVRKGHIRARFHREFNEFLRNIRASGLWTQWNQYPRSGTPEFTQACARHHEIVTARSSEFARQLQDVEPMGDAAMRARLEEVMANEHHPEPPAPWDE